MYYKRPQPTQSIQFDRQREQQAWSQPSKSAIFIHMDHICFTSLYVAVTLPHPWPLELPGFVTLTKGFKREECCMRS